MQIRKGVDLGASFERLKKGLEDTRTAKDNEEMAYNMGYLRSVVKLHIAECTTDEPETNCENPDDIPDGLFTKSGSKYPSNFLNYPYSSVLQKAEAETVARNIMFILNRTGNEWRSLSWEEYREERLKDKGFDECEKRYFDEVSKYCQSEESAKLFSPTWE